MKEIKWHTALKFFAVWLILLYSAGFFNHVAKLPMGVHQGAQCDRASLAQNFYYGGFKFLYPEVNENRCIDGIVSCEFPLTSYLAAALYATFGYNELWFRLLTMVFAAAGLFSLFLLLRRYVSEITALLMVMTLQFSPIFIFYTAGFIPDMTSLGLSLIAWCLFFYLFVPHPFLPNSKSKWQMILVSMILGLAIAVKTTTMVQWMTMAGLITLSYIPKLQLNLVNRKQAIYALLGALILPVAWFMWSRHLAETHNSQYFMMRVPWLGKESYSLAWQVYRANWPQETFSRPLIYIAVTLLVLPLFLYRQIPRPIWVVSTLNTLGSLAFLILMMEQFKYHDYYIICLTPAFLFSWLAMSSAIQKINSKYWWFKVLLFLLFVWAFTFQYNGGKVNLNERFTEGNYWEQSHVRSIDYDGLRPKLRKLGIDRNTCVIVGYDVSPNNTLYLMHLRGHRFSKDHGDERIHHIIHGAKPSILISNDTTFTQQVRGMVKSLDELDSFKYIHIYKINH